MSGFREPDTFVSAGYLAVLRRRWWLVLVLTGVGLLAGAAYLELAPKAYTASAEVNVTPIGTQSGAVAGGRTLGAVNLDTEAQIVKSGTVESIAVHDLHSTLAPAALEPATLEKAVSVTVPANSTVLQISCQEGSADHAAACANAFAAAYLQNRDATAAAAVKAQLGYAQDQLSRLNTSIAKLTLQIGQLPATSPRRATDQAELETATSQQSALASQYATLSSQGTSPSGGSIISKAIPPTRPSSPKKLLALPSGLLVGLILGLVVAFSRDRMDTRVKDASDIGRFAVPVLLSLPGKRMSRALVAPAGSAAGREFTELARSAAAALGNGKQLLIAGTAAARARGSSLVAANLAVALGRRHGAVILVCPSQEGAPELFGLVDSQWPGPQGVAQLASGAIGLDQAAQQPRGFPGVHVLVLGAGLSDLAHEQVRQLAAHLRASADYVLIEAPSLTPGGDSLALAAFCDAALLAVEISRSRLIGVDECLTRLRRLRVRVIGAAAVPRLGAARPPRGQQAEELPDRGQRAVTAGLGRPADARNRGARRGWPEPEVAGDATGIPSMSKSGRASNDLGRP
jgi:capsular polysaccharide biosynthesis protein